MTRRKPGYSGCVARGGVARIDLRRLRQCWAMSPEQTRCLDHQPVVPQSGPGTESGIFALRSVPVAVRREAALCDGFDFSLHNAPAAMPCDYKV